MRIDLNGGDDKKIVIQSGELPTAAPPVRSPASSLGQTPGRPLGQPQILPAPVAKKGHEFLIAGGAIALVILVLALGLAYFLMSGNFKQFGEYPVDPEADSRRQPSARAEVLQATQKYWIELGQAFDSLAAEGKETASETSQRFRQAARHVSGLSVMNVDEEAMEIGSSMIELMGHTEVVFDGWQRLVDDSKALGTRVNSPELMFESMLRGFLGDPMGVNNEVKIEKGKLDQRQQELLQQLETVQRESNDLRAKITRIRAKLSARYGVEFPPLN